MLILSALLDLICWKCREVTKILMYLEFLWITFDTIFVLKTESGLSELVICFRFLASAILLGISARQTILAATFGVAATLILEHYIVIQGQVDVIEVTLVTIFVFSCSMSYFLKLKLIVRLQGELESSA